MDAPVLFLPFTSTRMAWALTPRSIRIAVPARSLGSYLLLRGTQPIYVGRSDSCVRARLLAHASVGLATHFLWEPCSSPSMAFLVESIWFHRMEGHTLNVIHPARPVSQTTLRCPICHEAFATAVTRMLASMNRGKSC